MNAGIVGALVAKDFKLFFRNRFFALITVLGLAAFAGMFYLLPNTVNEELEIGLVSPPLPPSIASLLDEEGASLVRYDTEDALTAAIAAGDIPAGIVLPSDLAQMLASGQKGRVKIYFASDFPEDMKQTYIIFVQELAFMAKGQGLNIEGEAEVLGVDRAGAQVPPRERMLPLLAVFVLMMETMGLANLISGEVAGGTLRALLTTPLRVEGLFVAKGITGVAFTFTQAALLVAVTGGLNQQPLIVLTALLLGSLLVTGIGFLIASVTKDILSVLGLGVLALIILALPAFGILMPGTVSQWVRVIPSYYVVDTIFQAANFSIGWSDVAGNMLILLASSVVFLALGVIVLKRKFQ
jgi:ABC-2 type transport system permease protein